MTPEEVQAKLNADREVARQRIDKIAKLDPAGEELQRETLRLAQKIVADAPKVLAILHEAQERDAHPLTWKLRRWLRRFSAKSSAK